ncbi:MAG: GGDEF domain-containing protein [Lachnospiraceae bacterium]|nr:GGDEF domain-containing protein [Lachnospiraceae bacterium]
MGLLNLINKDVSSENETRRGMVTLRILYLIQAFVFFLDVLFAGTGVLVYFKYRIVAAFIFIPILFLLTYTIKSEQAVVCYIFFTFIWSMEMIPCFGWSGGMQNYCLIILLLSFFTIHGSLGFKFSIAGLVLVARIMMIFCFGGMLPVIEISDLGNRLIQTANISAVFVSIIMISYIYSHRENEAESKLMRYNDRLVREASTDKLTGLYNRRKAEDFLKEVMSASYVGAISLAIGDIDFFKKVNDTYGHDAGDAVLKAVADTMREVCGKEAFLTRWGGEEFLLIFAGKNGDETYLEIEKLRTHIMNHPITVKDSVINVTMTYGLAEYDFSGNIENTIKEADKKLYTGKESGRNRVVY